MTIEEYKEMILHQLEKAGDCEEVEQIIHQSVERMRQKHLNDYLVNRYLHSLYDSLTALSPTNFDSVHWCNICCAVMLLKRRIAI